MEQSFATMFEDVRYKQSIIVPLSLTDLDIIKKSKFTDDERNLIKNLVLEKLHRQRILKEQFAMDLLEKQISD